MSPNAISFGALAVGIGAGACYGLARLDPLFYPAGGLLVAISGLADALDGVVARLHGRTSSAGDFLDHVFDRFVNMAIMGGLALSPGATVGLGLGAAILVLLNSYMGTQIQASFGTRYYSGLGKAELFVALVIGSLLLGAYPDAAVQISGRAVSAVDLFFVVVGVSAVQAIVHRFRLGMRLGRRG